MTTTREIFERTLDNVLYDFQADGDLPQFNEMVEKDRRKLAAAYIEDNEDIVHDVLYDAHQTSLAQHCAALLRDKGTGRYMETVYALAADVRRGMMDGDTLAHLIQGEIDTAWDNHVRERQLARSEYLAMEEDR